jgi:hypothetical protein
MAGELVAYGEIEAAEKLLHMDTKTILKIGLRAHEQFSEGNLILDKAICLAIVEHIEGKSRELKRKKRSYPKDEQKKQE